jgi:hypothetical protein
MSVFEEFENREDGENNHDDDKALVLNPYTLDNDEDEDDEMLALPTNSDENEDARIPKTLNELAFTENGVSPINVPDN